MGPKIFWNLYNMKFLLFFTMGKFLPGINLCVVFNREELVCKILLFNCWLDFDDFLRFCLFLFSLSTDNTQSRHLCMNHTTRNGLKKTFTSC